jgi:hypothetical protein
MSDAMFTQVALKTHTRGFTYQLICYLARLHHDEYGYAWPGIAHLAGHFRVSERTIQRHLATLERLGELSVERVRGRGRNNRFYLLVAGVRPPHKGDRLARKGDRLSAVDDLQPLDFAECSNKKVTSCPPYRDVLKAIETTAPARLISIADKPERQSRFWCDGCGYVIQACRHRIIDCGRGRDGT